MTRRPLRRHAP